MSRNQFGTDRQVEVAIIGGGVIGLSIARGLAHRGIRDVVVIEKNEFGREASWAAGGILAPQIEADRADDFFHLACASRNMYRQFAAELKLETGLDVEFDMTGTIYVAFNDKEERELRNRLDWQRTQGLRVEWLSGDEARALEPALSMSTRCALRFPHDYRVDNRKLVEALIAANKNLGGNLIGNCDAKQIGISNATVVGIETDCGFLSAKAIVVSAGAWSSLIQTERTSLPQIETEPVRGQMLCFKAPGLTRHVIYSSRGYVIPRVDGRLLAGSTSEHVGFDKAVTDAGMRSIKSMAFQIAPALEQFPIIDSWAGFRPRAKDDSPVLGAVAGVKGLFYATGHYRNGILLAPVTGELMARAILGEREIEELATFSPNRFASNPISGSQS